MILTNDADLAKKIDSAIFPGFKAARSCMSSPARPWHSTKR